MNQQNKLILLFSLFLAGILSLFASTFPDGLEKVAENFGFIDKGHNIYSGIFSDYTLPGIVNQNLAASLAGLLGTLLVFGIILFLGKVIIYVFNQAAKNQRG